MKPYQKFLKFHAIREFGIMLKYSIRRESLHIKLCGEFDVFKVGKFWTADNFFEKFAAFVFLILCITHKSVHK